MPESMSSWGVATVPADTTTSLLASSLTLCPNLSTSTPTALPPSTSTLVTRLWVNTVSSLS